MMMICLISIQVRVLLVRSFFKILDRLDFRRLRASDLKSKETTTDENTSGTKRKAETSQVRRTIDGED